MSGGFYSEHDYSSSSYSSTEEEYDREFILDATTVDEERFITPHGELSPSSDVESNIASYGSSEEDNLEEPINTTDDETHNYSSVSAASEDENHRRSHHRINRIEMYSGEEDMFEYSDGDIRLPTRWHSGDERQASTPSEPPSDDSSDSMDSVDYLADGLPENISEYIEEISFDNDLRRSKIVTDQCKYTLEDSVKCLKCYSCGDTFSAEGLLEHHSYHLEGKLPECPTCKAPIELSALLELTSRYNILDIISMHFRERLKHPVFKAYSDTVKVLHENGYINPDADKKTIIDFLQELIRMRDGPERPIPQDISQEVYQYLEMIEKYINELLTAVPPELTEKRLQIMDELNALPVKYGLLTEPLKPVQQMRETSADHIISNVLFYRREGNYDIYTHTIDTPMDKIIIRENIIGQSPMLDARFKGYKYIYDKPEVTDIPELERYIPSTDSIQYMSRLFYYEPITIPHHVHILQPDITIIHKTSIVTPRLLPLKDALRGSAERRISAVKYYIEFARILAEYMDNTVYSPALLYNANGLEMEFNNWYHSYVLSINSPSDIIGMVYQMITENGAIDPDFKAKNFQRTYAIFKRSGEPIQTLIDATIDAMLPMLNQSQRRIINEMLTINKKANPFHCCPLRFLKSLTIDSESKCSCGGPILEHACLLCGQLYCKHCHEQLNAYHSCNPEVLETIKVLDETTIRCPKCLTRIQKTTGCDHMFCINCHCNFDWKTGQIIKESEQTNDMYENAVHDMERDYMYYIRRFIAYYESTKRNTFKFKSDLLFLLTCRNNEICIPNIDRYKAINNCLMCVLEAKRYKETYIALRPAIASAIDNTMATLGETIDDYTADRVAERIVAKGVDALRLS